MLHSRAGRGHTLVYVCVMSSSMAVHPRPFIRGASLGSLFIPENWMYPSFYAGSGTQTLCELVRRNHSDAIERMERHLSRFVREADFAWLAAQGFNAVRVPLGYWNVFGSAGVGIPYVPEQPTTSLRALDDIFGWGAQHGIQVFLDLHGAPGSQNGADHSGCDADGINWLKGPNVDLSLRTVHALARRYGKHKALLGIELLNEPAWAVEWSHGSLLNYYTRALALVRSESPTALVAFNLLFWDDFPSGFGDWWSGQFVGENIVLDLHLYDCYGAASQKTLDEHLAQARAWQRAIERFRERGHSVIVGEWSLATGVYPGGQAWADAQLDAFAAGVGWFFWSLQTEGGGDTWSLRGVLESGIVGLAGNASRGSVNAAALADHYVTNLSAGQSWWLQIPHFYIGLMSVVALLTAIGVWYFTRAHIRGANAWNPATPVPEDEEPQTEYSRL